MLTDVHGNTTTADDGGKMTADMPPRLQTNVTRRPRLERKAVRDAWAWVDAETIKQAAKRLGMLERGLASRRTTNQGRPEGTHTKFPDALPIGADYNARHTFYSGREFNLWRDLGFDLSTNPAKHDQLRAEIERRCAIVQPVTLKEASRRLFDSDDRPDVARLRGWIAAGDRNGAPTHLPVRGAGNAALGVFSWVELSEWWSTFRPTA